MAAVVVASGLAQVAQIRSQNVSTGFLTGGSFTVPGSGGADSQTVAFRASPGEQVTVATPTQVRKGTNAVNGDSAAAQPAPAVNQRIINVLDPAMVGDYLATPEGEQVLVNVMRRNSDAVRQIAGGA